MRCQPSQQHQQPQLPLQLARETARMALPQQQGSSGGSSSCILPPCGGTTPQRQPSTSGRCCILYLLCIMPCCFQGLGTIDHSAPLAGALQQTCRAAAESWATCAFHTASLWVLQGERMAPAVADDVRPTSVAPCGNYAVQILWEDGFNQARI